MHQKWLHNILAVILLGVFAFHTTPREFIHQFTHHHDTVDAPAHAADGVAISARHQHCDFLQIGIEPYEQITFQYSSPAQAFVWIYAAPYMPVFKYQPYSAVALRAPPAAPVAG